MNLRSTIKLSLLFIPSVIIFFYFLIYPLSPEEHKIMENSLMKIW